MKEEKEREFFVSFFFSSDFYQNQLCFCVCFRERERHRERDGGKREREKETLQTLNYQLLFFSFGSVFWFCISKKIGFFLSS